MSYHPLGLIRGPSVPVVTVPEETGPFVIGPLETIRTTTRTTTDPGLEEEIRAKEAALRTEELKRQQMAEEELRRADVTLPAQPPEDWTPVPEAFPEAAPEQKVPWLLLGVGGVAVLGIGYWMWSR